MEARNAGVNPEAMNNQSTRNHGSKDGSEPEIERLRGRLIQLCLMLLTFAQATQSTYLLAALPYLERDFDISFRDSFALTSVFLGIMTLAQAIGNDLRCMIGRLPVILMATILLTAGTMICALARSAEVFTAGRALQGAGAGIAEAVKAYILVAVFDTRSRPKMVAILDFSWLLGFAAGPILGICLGGKGLFWQSGFWLVVPLMVISGFCMPFLLRPEKKTGIIFETVSSKRVNPVSQIALIAATATLISGLGYAGCSREWSSPTVIGWLTASLACCVVLVVCEKFAPWWDPLLRKTVFNISTCLGLVDVFINSCLMWMLLYFMALYFLHLKNTGTLETAVHTLSITLTTTVIAVASGSFIARTGHHQPPASCGWVCVTGAFALLHFLGTDEHDGVPVAIGILGGLGFGASFSSAFAHPRESSDKHDETHKIRMTWQVRAAGQTCGLLLGSAVFGNELYRRLQASNVLKGDIPGVLSLLSDSAIGSQHPDSFVNVAILDSLMLVWIIGLAFACLGFILSLASLCVKSNTKRNERSEVDSEAGIELSRLPRPQEHTTPSPETDEESGTETLPGSYAVFPETPEVRGDPNVPPTIRCVPQEEDDLNSWTRQEEWTFV